MASSVLWKYVEKKIRLDMFYTRRFYTQLKSSLKQPKRCNWYSTNTSTISHNLSKGKKGFLVYQNLDYNLKLARTFVICGGLCGCFASVVALDIKNNAAEVQEDSGQELTWVDRMFQGTFASISPYIYGGTALFIVMVASVIVGCTVKKMLLSTDHQTVTIITYRLFGGGRITHVPTKDIRYNGARLKVVNFVRQFQVSSSTGKVVNPTLFDHVTRIPG